MRWVDRGAEPGGVAGYARQFTPGWVNYFRDGIGGRPNDFYWTQFRSILGGRTNNICWYRERQCVTGPEVGGQTPTVGHFRPLSRFPELAYIWANWNFSCRRCNASKGNQWPELGYINPCADDVAEHPQQYLDYDELTGDIIPKSNIPAPAQRRAWDTIDDLGLNALDVKIHRLECIQDFLNGLVELSVPERLGFIESFLAKPVEYAGTIETLVDGLRRSGRI